MRRALIALSLALVPGLAAAQGASEGQRLFTQSCSVCHLKPNLTAGLFGPALDRSLVAGQEKAMHDFIADGTQRMPGFRYQFDAQQIDAIIDYLKTVPPAQDKAAAPPAAAPRGRGAVD